MYQPVIFEDSVLYSDSSNRDDCDVRYNVIKENYGSFKDKTMVDIGCANGFFGFKFLLDGGIFACGVEIDRSCLNYVRRESFLRGLNFKIYETLMEDRHFSIGVYLDLHYHEKTDSIGYIEYLQKNCDVVFTSSCRKNEQYKERLKDLFDYVDDIYKGYQDRIIYKCKK